MPSCVAVLVRGGWCATDGRSDVVGIPWVAAEVLDLQEDAETESIGVAEQQLDGDEVLDGPAGGIEDRALLAVTMVTPRVGEHVGERGPDLMVGQLLAFALEARLGEVVGADETAGEQGSR